MRANLSLLIILTVLVGLTQPKLYAQSAKEEIEIFQNVFGLEKKAAVADLMNFGSSEAEFWRVYDEYEIKRKDLGKQRMAILVAYAQNYNSMDDGKIKVFFDAVNKFRKSETKLQNKYFKKMSKIIGVSKAAQFWQFENYVSTMIQATLLTEVPFIGEALPNKN